MTSPSEDPRRVVHASIETMGGAAHLVIVEPVAGAVDLANDRLEQLEHRWSRFRPDSELCTLNRAAGRWHPVSADTFALVDLSVTAWHATAGAFDPTVLNALERAGYDRTFSEIGDPIPPPETSPAPGCAGVLLEHRTHTVFLPAGVALDSGGLGKGLAADLVCSDLLAAGCAGASVNVGGDVRCSGTPPQGDRWVVGVEDPYRTVVASLALDEGAVASSSTSVRRWSGGHHIIDPRTGRPTDSAIESVSVLAPTAAYAEILTTALMVDGVEAVGRAASALECESWGALVEEATVRLTLGAWPRP